MLLARILLPVALLAVLACTQPDADPPAAQSRRRRTGRSGSRTAKMPAFDKPVPFDTPEADAILAALEVFPPDNPWNLVVEDWPLHPDSQAIVASIGAGQAAAVQPGHGASCWFHRTRRRSR